MMHASNQNPTSKPAARLSFRQAAVVALIGALLWFVGIFQIRWVGSTGALNNGLTPLVYALIVVGTIPFILLTPRLIGLPATWRMHCGAIMGAVASLLDGIAVRWTNWYSSDARLVADSAATLLWAIGVAVALGYVLTPKDTD